MIYLSGVVRPEILGARADLGVMMTPRAGNRPDLSRTYWALDNGLYHDTDEPERQFDDDRFFRLLDATERYKPTCLFLVCPDVPYEDVNTITLSMLWWPALRKTGYPLALAAQNGMERWRIPWECYDWLFLGGTVDWKFSPGAAGMVRQAKARGLRVHLGKCNSLKRLVWAKALGCDTADGTYVAFRARGGGKGRGVREIAGWLDQINGRPPSPPTSRLATFSPPPAVAA
ncbi:MAG TPA: hypothetical protein VGJ60_07250 [Chloroflexota bacterium]